MSLAVHTKSGKIASLVLRARPYCFWFRPGLIICLRLSNMPGLLVMHLNHVFHGNYSIPHLGKYVADSSVSVRRFSPLLQAENELYVETLNHESKYIHHCTSK